MYLPYICNTYMPPKAKLMESGKTRQVGPADADTILVVGSSADIHPPATTLIIIGVAVEERD